MLYAALTAYACILLWDANDFDDTDASVTQSALEEVVASKMQNGGIGSTISMFRSRYLPK